MNVWDCFETLLRENNPRLMVIIETDDARYLLAVRDALRALTTNRITKGKIANAKQVLAQQPKEAHDEASPHHNAAPMAQSQPRRARGARNSNRTAVAAKG
jgi:hypothetical protein